MAFWKKGIIMLASGWIVIWISRMMFTPIYPVLSSFFNGATSTQLGLISSFYFLGYVIMQIPSGLLVDRLGMKAIVVPGFLVFSLGTVAISLSTGLPALYAGSFFSGLGCGTFFGIAYTITNVYVPAKRRSLATAIVNSGTAIGSGIGLSASSCLVGTGILPWQALATATALAAAVMAVVYLLLMPGRNSAASPVALERKLNSLADERTRSGFFSAPMLAAYILYFGTLYLYYLIGTWLPDYLGEVRGFDSALTGIVSSLVFFAGIPGALACSRLADRKPQRKIPLIIALELIASIGLAIILHATSLSMIIVGILLYGLFGKLAVEPILISWLGRYISPWSTATALGILNTFGMSGSVIAPLLTGALNDATGIPETGYYVAVAIVLACTAVFAVIVSRRDISPQNP